MGRVKWFGSTCTMWSDSQVFYCYAEKTSVQAFRPVFRHIDQIIPCVINCFNSPHQKAPIGSRDDACGTSETVYHIESREISSHLTRFTVQ